MALQIKINAQAGLLVQRLIITSVKKVFYEKNNKHLTTNICFFITC